MLSSQADELFLSGAARAASRQSYWPIRKRDRNLSRATAERKVTHLRRRGPCRRRTTPDNEVPVCTIAPHINPAIQGQSASSIRSGTRHARDRLQAACSGTIRDARFESISTRLAACIELKPYWPSSPAFSPAPLTHTLAAACYRDRRDRGGIHAYYWL